jgi:hypothetical protein
MIRLLLITSLFYSCIRVQFNLLEQQFQVSGFYEIEGIIKLLLTDMVEVIGWCGRDS